MTQLIWHMLNFFNITPWFEWVGSDLNIADKPTIYAEIPFHVEEFTEIKQSEQVRKAILKGQRLISEGSAVTLCGEKILSLPLNLMSAIDILSLVLGMAHRPIDHLDELGSDHGKHTSDHTCGAESSRP